MAQDHAPKRYTTRDIANALGITLYQARRIAENSGVQLIKVEGMRDRFTTQEGFDKILSHFYSSVERANDSVSRD